MQKGSTSVLLAGKHFYISKLHILLNLCGGNIGSGSWGDCEIELLNRTGDLLAGKIGFF